MNTWDKYLEWRNEKGYTGLSTEEQYNEFLSQVGEQLEGEKLNRKELHETEELFSDLTVKGKVAQTFEAIKSLVTVGTTIAYNDLAKLTGQSLRTVKRHVEELQEKGYLHVKRGVRANTYYWGVDMRQLTNEKKKIHSIDEYKWNNEAEDIAGEITILEESNELHVTIWNVQDLLDCTHTFLPEESSFSDYYHITTGQASSVI
ncbi:winged helix-turn-helix domain-containing protein [Bacillus nitratireducens]|uniref:winged helix-turn-helix domain-containing protein n=1 Tax=Bacillus nitratireducens TaxID=2026193 RepID=UPI00089AC615|nr:winged helix-turn-helix domain-containing protein [Bacillus nitratireducens]SDZ84986.1 Winged helix-turn-helix DNA-binding [Bacillus nitratireducens]